MKNKKRLDMGFTGSIDSVLVSSLHTLETCQAEVLLVFFTNIQEKGKYYMASTNNGNGIGL